ncbi:MAG: hypothetical protein ACJ8GN_14255 [Longimicrobiaceae bacterium]
MAKLTRREQRRLEVTGNLVRMYVAVITFVFPILCVMKANAQYDKIDDGEGLAEIPRASTYGNIMGIYLPLFAAVAAYVWATRAFPKRQAAPHGYAMALFRDAFTVVVVTTVLYVPVLLYGLEKKIQEVNPLLVWYQTIVTAVAGAAFAYYFHASLTPSTAAGAGHAEAAEPASPSEVSRSARAGRGRTRE